MKLRNIKNIDQKNYSLKDNNNVVFNIDIEINEVTIMMLIVIIFVILVVIFESFVDYGVI